MVTEVLTTFEAFDNVSWSKTPEWVFKKYTTWFENGKEIIRSPKSGDFAAWKNYRNVKHWVQIGEDDLKSLVLSTN